MSKFCVRCGAAFQPGQKFCGKCGTAVTSNGSAQGAAEAEATLASVGRGRSFGRIIWPWLIGAVAAAIAVALALGYTGTQWWERTTSQSKGQPASDSSNTSADVAPSPRVPAQAPADHTKIQSAAPAPEELVAGLFEAVARGQANSFERCLAPQDRAYFAGLTAERKTEIVRMVRILFGFEDSSEFVNDFEGTVRVSSRASRSLVLTLDGKFGSEFQGVGISFTHKGDGSVVMARPGDEPWGQVDLLRAGNMYVLRNVRLLTPHPKTTTGFSDFIRGRGDFEKIFRWYRFQVGGRYFENTVLEPENFESNALRDRVLARYEVVPLTQGLALRPLVKNKSFRVVEIANGIFSIDGTTVTGRQLTERVGADADILLSISYLSVGQQRKLFGFR